MSGKKRDPSGADARSIAARVLSRVSRDKAYAAAALDAELDRHPQLDARERALATELCYGCLRCRGALLERLRAFAPRGIAGGDPEVEAHLLVAAYQLSVLSRVPDFAAVDAAVGAIKKLRGPKLGGFANAVLRKLAAGEKLERSEAVLASAPAWLRERLEQAVGVDEARALLGAEPEAAAPGVALRLVGTGELPGWLAGAEAGRASPRSRIVRRVGDPRRLAGYAEGAFVVQEEGAQVVGLALGAREGERVLDACAGRGQKSSLLAEQVGAAGELWATDIHSSKLRALAAELERLGLPAAHTLAVDWTVGGGEVPGDFDRVLVDAPCTGTGTLRRRPEIALRLEPGDPARLGELSARILEHAASHARPGGRVLFAVCSVLPEEAEQVVERVAHLLEPAPFDAPGLDGVCEPGATSFRLLPGRHGTDGYFVASFVRR
jgi:16S rRNA (cytosine967-C5)-methyltransferase